jgi:hypothetical protein
MTAHELESVLELASYPKGGVMGVAPYTTIAAVKTRLGVA